METEDIDLCKESALSPDCHDSSRKEQPDSDSSNTGQNEATKKADKSGENMEDEPSNTKESSDTTGQPREQSQSPEAPCSICLGKVENKSFTDSCFHTFCFVCLVEWSKVKPVCPLCKQPFKSIIHNVRSNEDYDQYHLESREAAENLRTSSRDQERFRYRTTLTNQNWIERQLELQRRQLEMLQRPSVTTARSMWSRQRQASTSAFRKRIYTMGMRVSEVRTACGRPLRQREVSPAFFRRNPACLHRLVPWLNRELNVLLHNLEDNVQFVLELIMDLLKRFDIQSEEFAEHLRSFLGQRTEHFIHEFYTFSRAPYDMVAYDSYAVYNLGNNSTEPQQISSPSSSDDSVVAVDVIASPGNARTAIDNSVIILNSDDEEVIPGQQSNLHLPPSAPAALSQTRMDSLLDPVRSFLSSVPHESPQWVWESPPIHIDWRAPSTSHTVLTLTGDSVLDLSIPSTSHQVSDTNGATNSMNYLNHVESTTSTPIDELDAVHVTDLAGSSPLLSVKVEYDSDAVSSYGSELEIVGYEKPYDERSAVDVSSAGEQELEMLERKRKKKLKAAEAHKTRSTSCSSSETRKARRRKRRTKTRSRSRHRSRSESPSYFREYARKRRKSRSRKNNRRSRSRQRGDRSRSRSRRSRSRHRRSRSRQRCERSYSRRSDTSRRSRQRSRSRKRRHSRSHSRRIERTMRSNSRSHSRSQKTTIRSRSGSRTRRSKKRSRSRSKPKRSRRRSRSVSVEYCALGRYDVPSATRRERESEVARNRRQKSPSYTYEWVHGRRFVETVDVRRRRDSSSSGSSSIVCISRRAGTDRRRMRRRKTSESIEVVYDSKRKSKKHKSEKDALRKPHKHTRRRSRSVSVDSRRRSVDKRRSREERSERREEGEKASCKKHPTGHKGTSKASVAREDTTRQDENDNY